MKAKSKTIINKSILVYCLIIFGIPIIIYKVVDQQLNNSFLSFLSFIISFYLIVFIGKILIRSLNSKDHWPNCKKCGNDSFKSIEAIHEGKRFSFLCSNCNKNYVLEQDRFMEVNENKKYIPYKRISGIFKKTWIDDK